MGTVLLKHDLQEVTTPILLTHGDADEIVDINGTADMFKALPDTMDKQFNIAPGGYHELHNEPNRRDVIELWIKWIHKHAEVASA
ncbi:hypothetical protein IWQ60_004157 [Tieghemiomyces parasiticus]|uniref:Serine aminopeptidase S33 domain-containing protein n=1 Tax=Tieghemiomyces parasiticus TaxID=78921 RepID=A0A9W8DVS1_9FUNG|nr:hypothetical protein IWQ60_004157 [Tieghemiomyces parasiticus]